MDELLEAAKRQIEFLTPLSDCQNKRDGLALAEYVVEHVDNVKAVSVWWRRRNACSNKKPEVEREP